MCGCAVCLCVSMLQLPRMVCVWLLACVKRCLPRLCGVCVVCVLLVLVLVVLVCVWWCVCGVVVCVVLVCGGVCVVCGGSDDSRHERVCPGKRADDATNSGGRTPGSKLPASPPPLPRPDGWGTPGRVPVYTAKKVNPSTDEQHLWSCTTGTSTTCVAAPLRPLPFNLN